MKNEKIFAKIYLLPFLSGALCSYSLVTYDDCFILVNKVTFRNLTTCITPVILLSLFRDLPQ